MNELLRIFGIDWKLLLAQTVNFAVLAVVLWKLVYKPVLKMLAARRDKIEQGLKDAEEAGEKIRKIEELKNEVLAKARKEELRIIKEAEALAYEKGRELIKNAHQKTEALLEEGRKRIEVEHIKSFQNIYNESAELVKNALVRVFEKSPEKFEDELIKKSLEELRNIK